ncbi:hypothetical protein C8J57DRAFT_1219995 [Mycena rebaudengoi]|nr:hypothetical protein C8J57DRAFT_1219995 [Mycena rebaudengoi]
MIECSRLRIQELRRQSNRRETINRLVTNNPLGFRAGNIVEIGFSIVAFKGNRDNNGLDAQVAGKMAAMSIQLGRIKPADSTKRRQVSADGTDRRTKMFCSSYSIIISGLQWQKV